uniref:WW domain-containing protein n=1 Tax=Plectus sambesii TaxID=2011161 RepID=A0A914VCV8_9BILA
GMFSRASFEAHTPALRQVDDADLDDEPGEDEVREYADTIGIDVDNEPELMWIARAGITAPMPSDEWRPVETNTGDLYFFNFKTKESSWEHPSDEKYRKMVNEERKRLQMRHKPSQPLSSPAANTTNQSPAVSNQVASQPIQPSNPVRPLGRLTPIGLAPLNNQSVKNLRGC